MQKKKGDTMNNNLNFKKIEENKDLIAKPTFNCIKSLFSE